jgi:hypothetical protein
VKISVVLIIGVYMSKYKRIETKIGMVY